MFINILKYVRIFSDKLVVGIILEANGVMALGTVLKKSKGGAAGSLKIGTFFKYNLTCKVTL